MILFKRHFPFYEIMKKCTRDQKWSNGRKSVKVKVYIYIYGTGYTKEKEESRLDECIKWNGRYVEKDTGIGIVCGGIREKERSATCIVSFPFRLFHHCESVRDNVYVLMLYNYRISRENERCYGGNMDERVTHELLIIRETASWETIHCFVQFNDRLNVPLCEIMVTRKKRKKYIKYVSI